MTSRRERAAASPVWITRELLDAIHTDLIQRYGGLHGISDEGLVDSALARPRNLLAHVPESDPYALAASLGYALVKNHGYRDANKRTAFVAMAMFLRLNGLRLDAPESEAVTAMVYVATDAWNEPRLADWLRRACEKMHAETSS